MRPCTSDPTQCPKRSLLTFTLSTIDQSPLSIPAAGGASRSCVCLRPNIQTCCEVCNARCLARRGSLSHGSIARRSPRRARPRGPGKPVVGPRTSRYAPDGLVLYGVRRKSASFFALSFSKAAKGSVRHVTLPGKRGAVGFCQTHALASERSVRDKSFLQILENLKVPSCR